MQHRPKDTVPPTAAAPAASSGPPLRIADARNAIRHVFIRDLVLPCRIGVHRHEHGAPQRVRINLDLAVREIVGRRHINLVETLAEEIASMCLEDGRVRSARVRIEKLDVLPDAVSVGVEIERFANV